MGGVARFHLAEFIEEELEARGWKIERLAFEMSKKEIAINQLAIEIFMSVREKGCLLGELDQKLADAFGVSVEFIRNLDKSWRDAQP